MRRWVISKSYRLCPRGCVGYERQTATVKITDPITGAIHCACKECGSSENDKLTTYKDRRPCKRCKNVYDVTVRLWSNGKGEVEEHWRERCSICELELSANLHLATGRTFLARARRLRHEQGQKKLAASVRSTTLLEVDAQTTALSPVEAKEG
jgi:hypothetical protein